jgi:hypothetical protein
VTPAFNYLKLFFLFFTLRIRDQTIRS